MRTLLCSFLALSACAPSSSTSTPSAAPTAGLEAKEGLFSVYLDRKGGRVLARFPEPDAASGESLRVVYVASLGAGMGSNPVGLDRGRTAPPVILAFRVVGNRLLAVAENHRFVAHSADPLERKAVRESFAESVLWAGEILSSNDPGILVDLSGFIARDAVGIAPRLKSAGQGVFKLDAKRSLVDPTGTLVFPDNVETEALLTFSSDAPGDEVVSTTPVPNAMTLRVHHSFVRLPDSQYQARLADPRISSVPYPIRDYAAGLDEPIEKRLVVRHRLELSADGSVKKPIVFYVDRGAPEPVRSALVEGARWWTEAFEAAGFPGGYKVEILPEGAHPLDARYNVIQWAHRETRGWSYGNPIIDPRTGEIIKGIVTLGSLRLRQDRMIFEGLLGAQNTGSGRPDDPVQLALARVRQLSAHEVGHCLGFLHNMAASSNDRASVMDYPAPWIRPRTDGTLDVTKAYSVGIGAWDKLAVKYSYAPTPPGQEEARFLDSIAAQGKALGLNYVVDPHARGLGA
ncbi:MAG: zinc-dependent metalloprotease, partial [Myxococcota bacterium]